MAFLSCTLLQFSYSVQIFQRRSPFKFFFFFFLAYDFFPQLRLFSYAATLTDRKNTLQQGKKGQIEETRNKLEQTQIDELRSKRQPSSKRLYRMQERSFVQDLTKKSFAQKHLLKMQKR